MSSSSLASTGLMLLMRKLALVAAQLEAMRAAEPTAAVDDCAIGGG
ncbi:hypothetical protein PCI56_13130 [Plesiomonas shigelloides subsp. oncorhynchi]|nr:hypothetical protein [Plesiomonas shigelloides]